MPDKSVERNFHSQNPFIINKNLLRVRKQAGAVLPLQDGIIVSGIGVLERHRPGVENTDPGGGEHSLVVVLTKPFVDRSEDLRRGVLCHRVVLDHGLCRHHKQRGGHPFSGHIGYEEADAFFVNGKIVIKVAADLPGSVHTSPQYNFRKIIERRRGRRQRVCLDLCRNLQIHLGRRQRFALVNEYDAIHDDQRHKDHCVLRCIAERTPHQYIYDQRKQNKRQRSCFLAARVIPKFPSHVSACQRGFLTPAREHKDTHIL